MESVKEIIESLIKTGEDINNTAKDVNKDSHSRKGITSDSLSLIEKLINENEILKLNFGKINNNLNDSLQSILNNQDEFKSNVEFFSDIILNINNIKTIFNSLDQEIDKLTSIVKEIRNDTDEIFTLALNASIVSTRYSYTSGVFDILANKLNEMSIFINHNLESIVDVVKPITDGIHRLVNENVVVLADIERGYRDFAEFPDILDKQKKSIDELLNKASISRAKIGEQKKMIDDINEKVLHMDEDAAGAINGSRNVIMVSESLNMKIKEAITVYKTGNNYLDVIDFIRDQSSSIWQTAQDVNEKSKSQLEFSLSCVDFCDSLISESIKLKEVTDVFNKQSIDNNRVANSISQNLGQLTFHLNEIEGKILDSNKTIQKFNEDYGQIDNILEFLKNILKSMNIIGMYSRIESARDPKEFQSFMTISENIRELQAQIQSNIPIIDQNISKTHELIENINKYFVNISSVFSKISKNSSAIIEKLEETANISLDLENIIQILFDESEVIENFLNELRSFLLDLTEVTKKPIEGSAENIKRGRNLESECRKIIELSVE